MAADELPMCCRSCAHKQSQYLYPAWTHWCAKNKPMVEGCRWKTPRTHSEVRNERKDY
jgi:hypothetical protein